MATGKVLSFDEYRGYGFISSNATDEDVFMHVNDLLDAKSLFHSGTMVEFDVENGDRGLKASNVKIVEREPRDLGRPIKAEGPRQADAGAGSDDTLCDVLSVGELRDELTEALLESVPEITGSQILLVRKCVLNIARSHNWVEQ